jgi:phosphatidylserine decarboxylase
MQATWTDRLQIAALRLLPRNSLSRLAGRLASARLPGPLLRLWIVAFGRLAGVDFSESRDPIESFATFQDFFTRALRPGVRPLDADPRALVAPCDGSWGISGRVENGTLLQIKGRAYRLAALLGDEADARRFEGGPYATFYLAPRDYHRFHAPCSGSVVRCTYLPGTLWPVNRAGLAAVDGVFAENERICAHLRAEGSGEGEALCLVAVGATMVGKVRLSFDDLTTNAGSAAVSRTYTDPPRLEKGQEWGRFEFGSTIVLVATPRLLSLDAQPPGSRLRLGARIGTV